ncbi:hypothetical protein CLD22_09135 [Rubrivivax gelatinosus]|nr:hypothetical protein [Rubrivivax gelatinosus]
MKTEQLIEMLAHDAGPAPRAEAARRLLAAAAAGAGVSVVAALLWLGPVPAAMFATPAPWFKLAYGAALALAAAWLVARLARPLAATRRPLVATAAVFVLVAAAGFVSWAGTPADTRVTALFGHSWAVCPAAVLLLSLPALGGALWALRGLAPLRPRAAGLAAGLLAGALGAFGYAFSCTEAALAFVALWYTLGIAASGALGALLGPRLLRW